MTDEEVNALLPVVDEFVGAVEANDARFIARCLSYAGRAPAMAVILAQRLTDAEANTEVVRGALRDARKQYASTLEQSNKQRAEIANLRNRVMELRAILHRGAA